MDERDIFLPLEFFSSEILSSFILISSWVKMFTMEFQICISQECKRRAEKDALIADQYQ
jgi:hypothetical protein